MANQAATPRVARGEASWRALLSAPLWLLAVIVLAFFLRETRGLFVPLALGFLASYVLQPVVGWLGRLGTPRVVSSGLVLAVVAGSVGALAWSLRDDLTQAMRELPQQVREMRRQVDASEAGGTLSHLQLAAREMQGGATEATGGGTATGTARANQEGAAPSRTPTDPRAAAGSSPTAHLTGPLAEYLWQGSFGLMTAAGQATVIVFFVFFLLTAADEWRTRLVDIAGSTLSTRRTATEVLDDINWQIQRFLLVRLITSALVAAATWVALIFFGAPAPGLWAVAAGVFNWVPYFGPIIVSTGLGIVGFVSGGLTMSLQLAAAALVITSLEGWLITPPLLGRASRMSTLAVFVSLLFWSWVWGIWGTILAVPLTSMIKAVSDHVEPLDWLSRLLSETPDRTRAG